ncbi:MAG TPA: twin-arginine translocase TatA/TatE family subunit [Chloroflexota bacterium]|nr:twin-arginine translocase TatA/TatE family subunit [Chloroflexota bacterium]
MPSLGAPELIIVLFLALILFGAGKLADAGKSLGQGIREFRRAVHEDEAPAAAPASGCPQCHAPVQPGDRFCGSCGHQLIAEARKAV